MIQSQGVITFVDRPIQIFNVLQAIVWTLFSNGYLAQQAYTAWRRWHVKTSLVWIRIKLRSTCPKAQMQRTFNCVSKSNCVATVQNASLQRQIFRFSSDQIASYVRSVYKPSCYYEDKTAPYEFMWSLLNNGTCVCLSVWQYIMFSLCGGTLQGHSFLTFNYF